MSPPYTPYAEVSACTNHYNIVSALDVIDTDVSVYAGLLTNIYISSNKYIHTTD